jgi:hypothetical protein
MRTYAFRAPSGCETASRPESFKMEAFHPLSPFFTLNPQTNPG